MIQFPACNPQLGHSLVCRYSFIERLDLSSGTPVQAEGPFGTFYALESTFAGGVNVSTGDVNGDSMTDLVLGGRQKSAPPFVLDAV